MGINLVFPVAGQAVRFGGTFKPFLKIGDVTFIETTLKPFEKWFDKIDKIYFICTDEQESHYNVTSEIKKIIPYDFVKVIKIKEKTGGPYQTLKQGIDQEKITEVVRAALSSLSDREEKILRLRFGISEDPEDHSSFPITGRELNSLKSRAVDSLIDIETGV